ncbi:hypothetical protein Tco_0471668 [Tanacetum coccineum]
MQLRTPVWSVNINSQPKNQFEHVDDFDIDESDLRPTVALRSCIREHQTRDATHTTQNLVPSTQTPEFDYSDETAVRIITSPAGIVQAAKIRKIADIMEGGQDCVMPAQDYIRKLIEDVGVDADFTRSQWVRAVEYEGVVKSCTTNALGDLSVTLKDPSGITYGTIHYKVLTEGGFGNDIIVGVALILKNVYVFSPKQSPHSLNITMTNMVKVFPNDTVLGDGTGVDGSAVLNEEEIMKLSEEEERAEVELQEGGNFTDQQEHQMRLDPDSLIHTLEEEARANPK